MTGKYGAMKKSTGKIVRHIDEFESSVSLYNLLAGGKGKGIILLKKIVDQIQNDNYENVNSDSPPNILITGKEGKSITAIAFLRALGVQEIRQIQACFIEGDSYLVAFFQNSNANIGYIIRQIEKLQEGLLSNLWQILVEKRLRMFNFLSGQEEVHRISGIVVLTSSEIKKVSKPIVDAVDFVVELGEYTQEQLQLIVLQRLMFSNIDYENEEVFKSVVEYGNGQLKHIIRFLRTCYTIVRADGRCKLLLSDIEKAGRIEK